MNADPCGSGSTALLITGFFKIVKKNVAGAGRLCRSRSLSRLDRLHKIAALQYITVGRLTVSSTGMILYCEEMFYEKFD